MKHSLENFLFKAWFEVREWHWVPTTMLCSFLTRLGISYFVVVSASQAHHHTATFFQFLLSSRYLLWSPWLSLTPSRLGVCISARGFVTICENYIHSLTQSSKPSFFNNFNVKRCCSDCSVEGFRPSVCVFNKLNVRQGDILDDPSGRLRYEARININKWLGHDDPTRPWQ